MSMEEPCRQRAGSRRGHERTFGRAGLQPSCGSFVGYVVGDGAAVKVNGRRLMPRNPKLLR
jgi:hypothetical protein